MVPLYVIGEVRRSNSISLFCIACFADGLFSISVDMPKYFHTFEVNFAGGFLYRGVSIFVASIAEFTEENMTLQ